jgi:hypothetical protein
MGTQTGTGGFPAIEDAASGGEVQERFRGDPTQPADATLLAMARAEIEVYGRCTPTICKRLVQALAAHSALKARGD